MALDGGTKRVRSERLEESPSDLMKFIEAAGSNKQKQKMSDSKKKNHLISSIGLGNFGLNSEFEGGLINSISSWR